MCPMPLYNGQTIEIVELILQTFFPFASPGDTMNIRCALYTNYTH